MKIDLGTIGGALRRLEARRRFDRRSCQEKPYTVREPGVAELARGRQREVVGRDPHARHVADELTMTEGNVRVIRHRAIGKLRTCMTSGTIQ